METLNVEMLDRIDAALAKRRDELEAKAARFTNNPLEGLDLSQLNLDALTLDEKQELLDLLTLRESMKTANKLADYKPYPRQKDFHDAGAYALIVERMLMAGNQVGKTWSAGFEVAMHLTGRYPDDWAGKRFNHPTIFWACGESIEAMRETVQRILLGRPEAFGTGSIPADCIIKMTRRSGVTDAIDTVHVRYIDGGTSTLTLKSYEQGREKFQGETLDGIWFDEEPEMEIYSEGKTRTQAGDNGAGGIVIMTFTPLKGMSDVVQRFRNVPTEPGTHVTIMTIHDALHYSPERRAAIIRSYPPHERKARAMGEPVLGSGAVFPVDPESISIPAFKIPWHWPRIAGVDFGWDHPAAGAWLAWDRETDTIYVYDCYAQAEQTPIFHAAYLKAKGAWIPIAWPHDGYQHGKSDGVELRDQYAKHGANMLEKHATSETDGFSVEPAINDMLERMQTGRFKVFSHLHDWFKEFKMYHRDKGLIVKLGDDIMSATRYACMDLRHAIVAAPVKTYIQSFEVMDGEAGY